MHNSVTKWFLVFIALLDFMGLGVVVAIFPHLLLDGDFLPQTWGYEARLTALGIFLAVYPLGQFFGAAILGKLSDIHGRRKLMILTLFGTVASFIVSGLSIVFQSAIMLLISRAVAGIFAGNVAIAQASMADISADHEKTKNLTLIQIALGLAWVFGPPLGGWASTLSLFNQSGFATSFWIIAGILTIMLIYALIWYKETSLKFNTTEKVNVLSGINQIVESFTLPHLRLAFSVWFIFVAGWWLFEAFLPAFLLKQYNFSSGDIGNFLASMGATYALFQYLVVNRVAKKMKPENMVKSSLIISGLSVFGIAYVNNIIILHILITLFVTSMGFVIPGLITSISNLADKDNQGKIMGDISSVQALATVLMMMIGGYLNSLGSTITIIGGALLLIISWGLFLIKF